jgi:hypothetical protein
VIRRLTFAALAALGAGACIDKFDICPPIERLLLPSGMSAVNTGELVSGAEMQTVSVDSDSDTLEYRFVRNGVTYTARYRVREYLPPTDAGMSTP